DGPSWLLRISASFRDPSGSLTISMRLKRLNRQGRTTCSTSMPSNAQVASFTTSPVMAGSGSDVRRPPKQPVFLGPNGAVPRLDDDKAFGVSPWTATRAADTPSPRAPSPSPCPHSRGGLPTTVWGMCLLVVAWHHTGRWPLVVGANRDEWLDRPTTAITVLRDAEPRILGGRDERAGGTWVAVNEHGGVCGLTNRPG